MTRNNDKPPVAEVLFRVGDQVTNYAQPRADEKAKDGTRIGKRAKPHPRKSDIYCEPCGQMRMHDHDHTAWLASHPVQRKPDPIDMNIKGQVWITDVTIEGQGPWDYGGPINHSRFHGMFYEGGKP